MRDDLNVDLAGFRVTGEDRVGAEHVGRHTPAQDALVVRALREPAPVRQRNGALWAVCASLLLALVGLGYWSHQQQTLLQQQLVATRKALRGSARRQQDSCRISAARCWPPSPV